MAADERPDIVLMSSAVEEGNPERQAAAALGLPIVKRDQFLPALLARRTLIAISRQAHGKSTTTTIIVKVLREAGIDCGYIIGTVPATAAAAQGTSPYFVLEADEYNRMFLGHQPHRRRHYQCGVGLSPGHTPTPASSIGTPLCNLSIRWIAPASSSPAPMIRAQSSTAYSYSPRPQLDCLRHGSRR